MMIMKPSRSVSGVSKLKMKKRLYEVSRVEILLKLMQKKKVDLQEVFKIQFNSPSFKFYESFDILLHKKIGDTR